MRIRDRIEGRDHKLWEPPKERDTGGRTGLAHEQAVLELILREGCSLRPVVPAHGHLWEAGLAKKGFPARKFQTTPTKSQQIMLQPTKLSEREDGQAETVLVWETVSVWILPETGFETRI